MIVSLPGILMQGRRNKWERYTIKYKSIVSDWVTKTTFFEAGMEEDFIGYTYSYTFNPDTGKYEYSFPIYDYGVTLLETVGLGTFYTNSVFTYPKGRFDLDWIYEMKVLSVNKTGDAYTPYKTVHEERKYTSVKTAGSLVDTVTGRPGAYPDNGIQGNYWYILVKDYSNDSEDEPVGINYKEYILSSGTQYFKTGFTPNQDTRVVCEVEFAPQDSTSQYLFGARKGSAANQFAMRGIANRYQSRYNNVETDIVTSTISGKFTIDFNKNVHTINGKTVTQTYANFTCPGEMFIFAVNNNGSVYAHATAKLYYMKIYDNGVLVRHYKPCLDPYGVACLYDEVNSEYIYNEGTGEFIAAAV